MGSVSESVCASSKMIHLAIIVPHGNMVLKGSGWVSTDKSIPEWHTETDPAATCKKPRGEAISFKYISHILYLAVSMRFMDNKIQGTEGHYQPVESETIHHVF